MELCAEKIGRFIQNCRKEIGLTQAEMAERLLITPQSVSNWERGETIPDISLLPDLACMLRCSVDAILSGGSTCGGYRRHVTVTKMREVIEGLDQIGESLGRDHMVYTCIIDAMNKRLNTKIEAAFADQQIFEVFTIELLLLCIQNGDYVDPRDVYLHLKDSKARDILLEQLKQLGIR